VAFLASGWRGQHAGRNRPKVTHGFSQRTRRTGRSMFLRGLFAQISELNRDPLPRNLIVRRDDEMQMPARLGGCPQVEPRY